MGFAVWLNISVQQSPFDLATEESELRAQSGDIGAWVAFQGMVRQHDEKVSLKALWIEHYPVFTESEITRTAYQANQRWAIMGCRIIHRVGRLLPGDPIVLVLVSAGHRYAAFHAALFLMDQLKTEIPFWKCEEWADGKRRWVGSESTQRSLVRRQ